MGGASERLAAPLEAGRLPQTQLEPLCESWDLARRLVTEESQMWHWESWGNLSRVVVSMSNPSPPPPHPRPSKTLRRHNPLKLNTEGLDPGEEHLQELWRR